MFFCFRRGNYCCIMEELNISLDYEEDGTASQHRPSHSPTHSVGDDSKVPPVEEDDIPDGDLNLEALPSVSASCPSLEPIAPKGPAQRFALNPSLLNGLSKEGKVIVEDRYKKHSRTFPMRTYSILVTFRNIKNFSQL